MLKDKYTVGELIEKLSTYDKDNEVVVMQMTNTHRTSETSIQSFSDETDNFIVGKHNTDHIPEEHVDLIKKINNTVVIQLFRKEDSKFALVKKELIPEGNIL